MKRSGEERKVKLSTEILLNQKPSTKTETKGLMFFVKCQVDSFTRNERIKPFFTLRQSKYTVKRF